MWVIIWFLINKPIIFKCHTLNPLIQLSQAQSRLPYRTPHSTNSPNFKQSVQTLFWIESPPVSSMLKTRLAAVKSSRGPRRSFRIRKLTSITSLLLIRLSGGTLDTKRSRWWWLKRQIKQAKILLPRHRRFKGFQKISDLWILRQEYLQVPQKLLSSHLIPNDNLIL